jgi:ribosomal protein S6
METKEIEKKQYEMSFLVKEEDGAKTVLKFIKELGGDIELEGPVMKVALSYPIKKQTSGFFGYFHFSFSPAEVKHLEHEMETSTEILRHLIITPPFKKIEPRPRPEAQSASSSRTQAPKASEAARPEALTNEDLEKKIEEILG